MAYLERFNRAQTSELIFLELFVVQIKINEQIKVIKQHTPSRNFRIRAVKIRHFSVVMQIVSLQWEFMS